MTLTQRIGKFAAASWSEREASTIDPMRPFLADYLVLAHAGSTSGPGSAVRATASESGASKLEGGHGATDIRSAALANGVASHALELDDTHEEGSMHPAVAVWPAVLAVADAIDATVEEVFVAARIGYDIMAAIATLGGAAEIYARGFHPTGVAGSLGAAAAVASLRSRGDAEVVANAVATAASLSAGSLEFLSDGAWTKPLNAGWAAMVGVVATDLARAGFVPPQTALEGRFGWLNLYANGVENPDAIELRTGLGAASTSIKFYPCCRYIHGAIDLLTDIANESGPYDAHDIDTIEVAVLDAGRALVADPAESKVDVKGQVDAQFSMPFGAALALTRGGVQLDDFVRAGTTATQLRPLMQKVKCTRSDALEQEFPAKWGAEVKITMKDGTVVEREESAFKGSPSKPASQEDIVRKGTNLVGDMARTIVDEAYAAELTLRVAEAFRSRA